VRLVDTANGIDFTQIQPDKPVRSISISGDSRLMAITSAADGACDGHGTAAANAGQVSIVRLSDGREFPPIFFPAPPCQAILSLDGRRLATALADGTAEAMEIMPQAAMTGAPHAAITPPPHAAITPAPHAAITPAPHAAITPAPHAAITPAPHAATTPAPLPATLTTGPAVQVRHQGPVTSVDFSPDGAWMASGGADRTTRVVDARTGSDVVPPIQLPGPVTLVQISNDGNWLAVADGDGTVQLIALRGQSAPTTFHSGGLINDLAFSRDSTLLATASADKTARIIDVATRQETVRIKGDGKMLAVAFSPDGRLLATGGEDGTARLIDVASGEEQHRLSQGDQAVNNVSFSPDGQFVATVNDDNTARLFAVASGDEVSRFERDRPITTVAYTPDGRLLAVGDTQQVSLYWADPQHIIDSLCARQGRNMSADEWAYYIGNGEPSRATCPGWRTTMSAPALNR
jgi:WD40 repeat protein